MTEERTVNIFAPSRPHEGQKRVLQALDEGQRFVLVRAGRKWRKTSLGISWLFEGAMSNTLTYPYIAPNRVQAKNIAWDDHVARLLTEFRKKGVPYKTNETELSVSIGGAGKVQLFGVENQEALRGISNWGRAVVDEYDDWEEDIWPTIIRPNLMVHQAPAIIMGTPKGFRGMYKLEQNPDFKAFHFTSYDNPDLPRAELESMVEEYKKLGEDYFRQEIMAEYVKPVGVVYREWDMDRQYIPLDYDPNLPLHVSFDWGVNDPTAIIWIQPYGAETRVIDYYEASDASIEHFIQVINAKPYKKPDLFTGDPAGKARTLTTGTSVIEMLADKGIFVRTKDGVRIPDQIRIAHEKMPGLYVAKDRAEGFRDCLLNYRYPEKSTGLVNQENEIPIHDRFCLHGDTKIRTLDGWKKIKELVGKDFYVWGYSDREKRLIPTKAEKCWLSRKAAELVEIVLDDGASLKCTPDHEVLLRDGTYKQAGKLRVGDSLMPFYEWNINGDGHPMINLNDGSSGDEHRIVFSRFNGHLVDGQIIHHLDGNKKNNNPDNLEQITIDEHCRRHRPHLGGGAVGGGNTGIRRYKKKCIWCGRVYWGTWKSIYCSTLCSNRRRSTIRRDERRALQPLKKCVWCGREFHAYARELTCSNKCAQERTAKYNSDYQKKRWAVRKQMKANHKVMAVKKVAGLHDVYDITVPETHNFVAEGVVVHNCHGIRAFEYWAVNVKDGAVVSDGGQLNQKPPPWAANLPSWSRGGERE